MSLCLKEAFLTKIASAHFSCIGGKTALAKKNITVNSFPALADHHSTQELYKALARFVIRLNQRGEELLTFVACFESPSDPSQETFTSLLWQQLKMLNDIDEAPWDKAYSPDTESAQFAFSLAGEAFFVIGGYPSSERASRQFKRPFMVFNAHQQFQQLRKKQLFTRYQKQIRQREKHFHGSMNPNIEFYDHLSEARQYPGDKATLNWRCPVQFIDKGEG